MAKVEAQCAELRLENATLNSQVKAARDRTTELQHSLEEYVCMHKK